MNLFARKKKVWITLAAVLTAAIALTAACALYLGDYYRADTEALEAFAPAAPVVSEEWKDGTLITRPEGRDPVAGLIFYPGGKVEHTAYTPLMEALASEGILCVLVEMPFRLAVLDVNNEKSNCKNPDNITIFQSLQHHCQNYCTCTPDHTKCTIQ